MATEHVTDRQPQSATPGGTPQGHATSAGAPPASYARQAGGATPRLQPRANQRRDGWRAGLPRNSQAEQLARCLGWFSIGLGLTEFLAPRALARLIGLRSEHNLLLRIFGLREMASGISILTQRHPTEGMQSRLWGDVVDLTFLGAALLTSGRVGRGRLKATTTAVVGVTALDLLCNQQLSQSAPQWQGTRVEHSVTINRSPAELYQFWRDFQHLPRFMHHLEDVQVRGERQSHWVVRAPAGRRVEWDAEITDDRPNELIAWRSLPGADVDNAGSVRFEAATGERGTVVRVRLAYNPPGGKIGTAIATLFGEEPGQQVQEDLRRFKQLLESGEMATTQGQPVGHS